MNPRRLLLALAGVLLVAGMVWAAGSALVPPEGRRGVAAGAAMGGIWQLLVLAVLAVALPGNRMIAHGVGMVARLALVAAAGLVIVPAAGLPQAPTLFTLVTVLFATTLIEPVAFSGPGPRNDKSR
ncbi:MAG TPA: hypothetical protein VFJ16_15675 [Longimicrobium sp.]|nr:hypothetical protein [Longimicrobium sp.]